LVLGNNDIGISGRRVLLLDGGEDDQTSKLTMTTEQHLQKIKAKCEELLAIAEKRTPGEWEYGNEAVWCENNGEGNSPTEICYQIGEADATFIAACAGHAEAGWKSTVEIIDTILFLWSERGDICQCIADDLIAAWPEDLL